MNACDDDCGFAVYTLTAMLSSGLDDGWGTVVVCVAVQLGDLACHVAVPRFFSCQMHATNAMFVGVAAYVLGGHSARVAEAGLSGWEGLTAGML